MSNPLGLPALFSPHPGGKGRPWYFRKFGPFWQSLICDRIGYYDVIVEPFAGTGATIWQHNHGCKSAISADIDPGIAAVWQCWGQRESDREAVLSLLEWHHEKVVKDAVNHFETLAENFNKDYFCMSPVATAASYLTLKRLVFGGVLRCNKKRGELNISLSQDKLEKYLAGWQYQWPSNGIDSLSFHKEGWEAAVQALAASDYERALVVIDPPYWTPDKAMTSAYAAGHENPADDAVRDLGLDCLGQLLEMPGKIARVVMFNYYSAQINAEIEALCSFAGCSSKLTVSNLGPLCTMNNGQGTGYHEYYDEAVWEIGGKRMFRDHDAAQQMSLLEVVR